jgi:MoxR-like ATPase
LKTHAFLSNPTRSTVEWVKDVQELAVSVLGHKMAFRKSVAVQPAMVLSDAFERMEETYGKEKWPKTKKQQETLALAEATEIYRKFEGHLNSKLWGRNDDATPGTIQLILNAFFADGHILFEDFPGSGKSFMATSMAELLDDDIREELVDIEAYHRIQCTPDLMPTDITGTTMLEGGQQVFRQGPVFAYFLLVDEINRTTPKVQSAFLEAMAEKTVSVDGRTNKLGDLFFVIATQNPLDKAGTFELPTAQLDRFLFKRKLEPIRERYEGRIMLDTAVKDAVKEVKSCEKAAWAKVMSEFKDDQPDASKMTKSKDAVNRVRVSKIIAAKRAILQNVSVHEGLVVRILQVANAIRDEPGDQGKSFFKSGSRPSVRSMQKFINAAKVRAFIDAISRNPGKTNWQAGEIVACPWHFRELACDLLRHRVVSNRPQDSDKIDDKIREIVSKFIKE